MIQKDRSNSTHRRIEEKNRGFKVNGILRFQVVRTPFFQSLIFILKIRGLVSQNCASK